MRWAAVEKRFRKRAADRGIDLDSAMAPQIVALMLDWYASGPARGVAADDGDMLLFQWGTYDLGDGPSFQYDITRQVTRRTWLRPDGAIWQLSATMHFRPELGNGIDRGHEWCHSADEVDRLREFIRDAPATPVVDGLVPTRFELSWDRAD